LEGRVRPRVEDLEEGVRAEVRAGLCAGTGEERWKK